MRVLIVEDSCDLRHLYARVLRRAGFRVYEASNGREALARLSGIAPDVILTDIMMPELDGIELIRRLRSRPATAAIPIVLMTAAATEEAKQDARQLGVADILEKPVDSQALLDRVKDVRR
jgi:CheY-like chemotaxis protein